MKNLPHPDELSYVLTWLRLGAPVCHKDFNSAECIKLLLRLVNALPSHFPQYSFGTDEWKEAMLGKMGE